MRKFALSDRLARARESLTAKTSKAKEAAAGAKEGLLTGVARAAPRWKDSLKRAPKKLKKSASLVKERTKGRLAREPNKILLYAAKAGDLDRVRAALEAGANVGFRDRLGLGKSLVPSAGTNCTALILACAMGHVEIVKLLLENDAQHDAFSRHGHASMHRAAMGNHFEIINALCDHDADPAIRSPGGGGTGLMLACSWGCLAATETLLKRGHPVDSGDNRGVTPLHACAEKGHYKCARKLVKAGCQLEVIARGLRPIHSACIWGFPRVVRILVRARADVHVKTDQMGDTPLHKSARHNYPSIVDILLQAGADPDVFCDTPIRYSKDPKDEDGEPLRTKMTPLMKATLHWNFDSARALVSGPPLRAKAYRVVISEAVPGLGTYLHRLIAEFCVAFRGAKRDLTTECGQTALDLLEKSLEEIGEGPKKHRKEQDTGSFEDAVRLREFLSPQKERISTSRDGTSLWVADSNNSPLP